MNSGGLNLDWLWYRGKLIQSGLLRAADGRLINADVNGSANLIRKVFPSTFTVSEAAGELGNTGATALDGFPP
jgi:hypothetical protein